LIQETHDGLEYHKDARKRSLLPSSGQESIYADWFEGKKTANGDIFSQDSYTAALLPEARWHAVPLGTRVELIHDGSQVVVEINDRGAGDRDPESTRVLDLSRAAASALTKQEINNDRDSKKAGVITLDRIKVVPANTPLGPVRP
jgi:peptidoglycan lytic transglycosylase